MALFFDPNARPAAPQGANAGATLIKDSDTQNFVADVIEASREVPIIVDFWAPWCGPCKQLGPLLEKLVRNAGGLVRLVKINVDENQNLAQQLRVQSIPMVYGFRDGRAVDGFMGAQPESNLRAFIERLTKGAKPPLEMAMEDGLALLESGDAESAVQVFEEVLEQDPGHAEAIAGVIRGLLALNKTRKARAFADQLPPERRKGAAVEGALAALKLAEEAGAAGDDRALRAAVDRDPDDHQARFDLAKALFARGDAEGAIDHLLTIVRKDRAWNEDAARKQFVVILDALGPKHPLTGPARRRLSSILFS